MSSTALPTRILGNSDLKITTIGFGAWAIGGGDWQFGWGGQDDRDSISAIHRALDLGINWIDTAAIYGLGHSEEIVAKALEGYSGTQPLVFTKCEMRWRGEKGSEDVYRSLKRESVREELEASLRRLKRETIDLYQIHWPDPEADIEEGWQTLQDLKREGKIRYAGISNFNVEQMERIRPIGEITSLQPPYSLIKPGAQDEILPYCLRNGIGVIAYSPMASGLLTGKMTEERIAKLPLNDWRRRNANFQGPRLHRHLRLVELLARIGDDHDKSPGEVAIAWVLRNPAVTAAIVGARRPEQIDGFVGAASFTLSDDETARLNQFLADNQLEPIRRP
jgi:aryl-alcohol dehydrogenase-like predicted oxidoreductase